MLPAESNIAICGHAKHGKSTLAGRLMFELGAVNDAALARFRVEAGIRNANLPKNDFNQFNWMFLKNRTDAFTKEGELLDPSRTVFPTRGSITFPDGHRLTLIDMPAFGQMFLDNIVYGIYIADFAMLLVEARAGLGVNRRDAEWLGGAESMAPIIEARPGSGVDRGLTERRSGAESTGPITEARVGLGVSRRLAERRSGAENIAEIMASFRVPVIAILVTKMDSIGYSEAGFSEVKKEIEKYVLPILRGYHDEDPPIIPISALEGAGVSKTKDSRLEWYKGINILEVVEQERSSVVAYSSRLRLTIEGGKEVYSPAGVGTVLVGSLETGQLRVNDKLILEPASHKEGKIIRIHARSIQRARSITEKKARNVECIEARAIVAVATSELTRDRADGYFSHGGMLGREDDAPTVAREIRAELIFFESDTVYSGKDYIIHPNAARGVARIREIESKKSISVDLDEEIYEANVGERIVAVLRLQQPVCVEFAEEFGRLTRFVLREGNRVVACGRCIEVIA